MGRWGAGVLVALSVAAPGWGQEIAADVLLLAKIKLKMAENQTGLPNYTCLQTVERYRRRLPSRKAELVDAVRLEVALVEGKELFSYPGAEKFEERELRELVPGGAIGNGVFALHARSVFLSGSAQYTYVGEEEVGGRKTIRYDYNVPQIRSGYTLRVGDLSGIAGYRGSFWVDAETLDAVRLEVIAQEIPTQLPLSASRTVMDYGRTKIGAEEFLLPRTAELTMVDLAGNESRNATTFSGCRQYAGESVLRFGEAPAVEKAVAQPERREFDVPGDLTLEARLETPIDSGKAAVGDVVTAVLEGPAKKKREVVLPKGARLQGRITRLEKRRGEADYYIVGLEMTEAGTETVRGRLRAALVAAGNPLRGDAVVGWPGAPVRIGNYIVREAPAEGAAPAEAPVVYVRESGRLRLPRGFRLVWRTEPPRTRE